MKHFAKSILLVMFWVFIWYLVLAEDLIITRDIKDTVWYLKKMVFTLDWTSISSPKVIIDWWDWSIIVTWSINLNGNFTGTNVFVKNNLCIWDDCRAAWPSLSWADSLYYTKSQLQLSWSSQVNWWNISNKPTTLESYWISNWVNKTLSISAGKWLTWWGDLSTNRTLSIDDSWIDNCTWSSQKIIWDKINWRFVCWSEDSELDPSWSVEKNNYYTKSQLNLSWSSEVDWWNVKNIPTASTETLWVVMIENTTWSISTDKAASAGIIKKMWNVINNKISSSWTSDYLPKFSSNNSISNSQIFENWSNIWIWTTLPSEKLEISWNIKLWGSSPTYRIKNLSEPVDNTDAANKKYVDTIVAAAWTTSTSSAYINNWEYYSVGWNPFYCRMIWLWAGSQSIQAINYRKPCDTDKYCNSNWECSWIIEPFKLYSWNFFSHSCILNNTEISCFGRNTYGQLWNWSTATPQSTPIKVKNLEDPIDLSIWRTMSCAVEDQWTLKCWWKQYNWLGDWTSISSNIPLKVSSITNASKVVFNNNYVYATLTSDSDATNSPYDSACVLLKDWWVKCWWNNNYWQLWDVTNTSKTTPVSVLLSGSAVKLYASNYYKRSNSYTDSDRWYVWYPYYCAIMSDSSVKCWWWNNFGMLWDGTATSRSTPVNVMINSTTILTWVLDLALTNNHVCALLSGGWVKCWWDNYDWQLWDGTTTNKYYATDVKLDSTTNLSNIKQIISIPNRNTSLGINRAWIPSWSSIKEYWLHYSSCALTNDGNVYCWWFGMNWILWNGTYWSTYRINSYATQSSVVWASKIVWVIWRSENYWSSICALISQWGKVKCWWWRSEYWQIWDGTQNSRKYSPVTVSSLEWVVDLYAGVSSVCAMNSNNKIYCWGDNNQWQLWDGTTSPKLVPGLVKFVMPTRFNLYDTKWVWASGTPTFCLTLNTYDWNLWGVDWADLICDSECGWGYKFANFWDMANIKNSTQIVSGGSWIHNYSNNCNNRTYNISSGTDYWWSYLTLGGASYYSYWNIWSSNVYCHQKYPLACVRWVR